MTAALNCLPWTRLDQTPKGLVVVLMRTLKGCETCEREALPAAGQLSADH